MKSLRSIAWRMLAFTLLMAVLLIVIVQAIERPVADADITYTAVFTDANGLKTGDDVRMFGVQVGKVSGIELDEDFRARVRFTVQAGHPVYRTSTIAIRFQTLVGQRYIDVRQPNSAGKPQPPGAVVGIERTLGSFDITALFNGLQPVLAELSPAAVNHFTETILAVLDGNGTGIGPALEAIERVSSYVRDRQSVLAVLVANLRQLADRLDGRSGNAMTLLEGIDDVFNALQQKLDGLVDFVETAPSVLTPIDSLAATLGLTPDSNPDLEQAVRTAFPDPHVAADVLGRLPALLQSLDAMIPRTGQEVNRICSHGNADVPGTLAILLNGQRISLCKR
ncbi:MlaD family protein [Nocardia pseudovaccinii]|uniref:MlaD family protein n=1 Tax=Nocardia pseudovaccinii TaxID=189540 RepID=UPI0007A460CE|nr:MlaD family protein [Nocardia pseudovaccinii]